MLKVILFSIYVFAAKDQTTHVHGAAQLSMAFDGKKGRIEFRVPGETAFGFEHQAKSKKDRRTKDEALQNLSDKISDMIVFEKDLECVVKMEASQVNQEHAHSEVEMEYSAECQKPVAGTAVTFNFKKGLSRIKKVKVEVIADTVQKSMEVKKNGEILDLK